MYIGKQQCINHFYMLSTKSTSRLCFIARHTCNIRHMQQGMQHVLMVNRLYTCKQLNSRQCNRQQCINSEEFQMQPSICIHKLDTSQCRHLLCLYYGIHELVHLDACLSIMTTCMQLKQQVLECILAVNMAYNSTHSFQHMQANMFLTFGHRTCKYLYAYAMDTLDA